MCAGSASLVGRPTAIAGGARASGVHRLPHSLTLVHPPSSETDYPYYPEAPKTPDTPFLPRDPNLPPSPPPSPQPPRPPAGDGFPQQPPQAPEPAGYIDFVFKNVDRVACDRANYEQNVDCVANDRANYEQVGWYDVDIPTYRTLATVPTP
eukprot:gene2328-8622_t